MYLYHYMEPQFLLNTILNNHMKLSTMNGLNDPNEMLPAVMVQDGTYAPIDYIRNKMREIIKNTGLFCMSRSVSCPAMWAHYADKHRGAALQFEFTDDQMQAFFHVDYPNTNSRVIIRPEDNLDDPAVRKRLFPQVIKTKAVCWQYEEEYRWVFPLQNKDVRIDEYGLFYHGLPEEWRRVILGVDCELNEAQVQKAIDSHVEFAGVTVTRARMNDSCFDIDVDPLPVDSKSKDGTL